MKQLRSLQLLWISLIILFSPYINAIEAKYYNDYFISATYYIEDLEEIKTLSKMVQEYAIYFNNLFLFRLQEPLSITVMPSVYALTSTFNVDSKVGALWVDNSSFFQPLSILKKVGKYNKTVFTEYSHFFFDSYTETPNWFKEGLSYYLWLNYSGESPIKGERKNGLEYLEKFSDYMGSETEMNNFYYNFLIYMDQLLIKYQSLDNILKSLAYE